jgi:(E)-4-hydroxy-3-methylbut-2-enyl-diphosphate synthase
MPNLQQQISDIKKYCNSLTDYSRFKTREVTIGNVKLGGDNPIVIQSMTTTDTMDTIGTVEQSIRMIEAGCELVRITAPSKKEAENLRNIKDELVKRGYNTPLVADIHFTPNAAEIAARIVEKVRVNPGNYADKKKFDIIEYSDAQYQEELNRIREKFTPLVKICKEHGTAIRIGTNHGSLSDRIMSRYGDTPLGMVESALEFLRICEDENYHNIVLSMKASNPQVMVQAYRLLVQKMIAEGMNYPLHLGVTEAGDGEDGRIKSAVGIGALLEDGLGDTIRVSLTEEPEAEVPVAQELANRYKTRKASKPIWALEENPLNPFAYKKRETNAVEAIGDHNHPIYVADLSSAEKINPALLFGVGYNYSVPLDKWNINDAAADFVFLGNHQINFEIPGTLGLIQNLEAWQQNPNKKQAYPLTSIDEAKEPHEKLNFVEVDASTLGDETLNKIKNLQKSVLVLTTDNSHAMPEIRRFLFELIKHEIKIPVVSKYHYSNISADQFMLYSSTDFGSLMVDGLGDGLWIDAKNVGGQKLITSTAFGIMQATRTRISKTEYISCPSCGRTLFDLQETTAKIRSVTNHLKGVKIGIMGCIVNGPGEMADADYGYVGSGVGKITLYKEKEVVRRSIPAEHAVDELIGLIKEHGDWVEPANA